MTRRLARITHDEVTRMVKAIRDLGLPIGRVIFDGDALSVVIGVDSGDKTTETASQDATVVPLLRKPKL
ncbi:MAG: hypothetical protein E5X86_19575 [Mesorhizobium sp.]|uniref:hypothetical protein n=1 Tax=Mesorhizobium sp. TaxID=1871066 RepID=UPI0011FA3B73|nr:hypothetical protein [Mesorhizobium sp.]TIO15574.1 MAG: hypothetical protein E5X86_19575 [Mesorhizobium sp.]TJW49324.1 MAG: hypothetical protein E5X65_34340 [Mesorhizobium sp.]